VTTPLRFSYKRMREIGGERKREREGKMIERGRQRDGIRERESMTERTGEGGRVKETQKYT